MSSPTIPAKDLQAALVNVAVNRLCAATGSLGNDLMIRIIAGNIERDETVAPIDQRFPVVAAVIEGTATLGAMCCNAFPPGEREKMAERFIATFREKLGSSQDMVDGWIASTDPLRAMAREKAKGGGVG